MKIIIDINHPAHVHFFKNIYFLFLEKGHEVIVTASLKEINYQLLEDLDIPFIDLGSYGNTPFVKMLNVPIMAGKMLKVVRSFNPDILMGIASSRICHGNFFSKAKTFVFTDTEHANEQIALFKPFAHKIITPDCFFDDLGKKQIRVSSFHELAYLHPNNFIPNSQILEDLGLKIGEPFFVVRFVSWQASHDIGQNGIRMENKIKLIKTLEKKGRVFVSDEGTIPVELEKYQLKNAASQMHDLLYYASMYIGEGGTMASEAAVLGTPSIFISTLTMSYLQELEKRFDLLFSFSKFPEALAKINNLLEINNLKEDWKSKRKEMLLTKLDFNEWMINYFENGKY